MKISRLSVADLHQKLPWAQIQELFEDQWVELVEYDWDWSQAFPSHARVRNFSNDRIDLMVKIQKAGEVPESVVLFLGATTRSISRTPLSASV